MPSIKLLNIKADDSQQIFRVTVTRFLIKHQSAIY